MGILANNNGKILRSNQTGNVLKQNYNFGYALTNFVNQQSTFLTLKYTFEYFTEEGTFELFTKIPDSDSGTSCFTANSGGGDSNQVIMHNPATGVHRGYAIWDSVSISSGGGMKTYDNISNLPVTYFTLSGGDDNGRKDQYFAMLQNKNSLFRYYNRKLSNSELEYSKNNLLGNEPLNRAGLIVELVFEKAEILDFGGDIGEAVGVRDVSGNSNHAYFENLPSGSLQEQLDYANENYFEIW